MLPSKKGNVAQITHGANRMQLWLRPSRLCWHDRRPASANLTFDALAFLAQTQRHLSTLYPTKFTFVRCAAFKYTPAENETVGSKRRRNGSMSIQDFSRPFHDINDEAQYGCKRYFRCGSNCSPLNKLLASLILCRYYFLSECTASRDQCLHSGSKFSSKPR